MEKTIHLRIKRQDAPGAAPYWEAFQMPYSPGHNVVSALIYLREHPINAEGKKVPPVVWECNCMEEVCGACSMRVNGRPMQACSTLVDTLSQPIRLRQQTRSSRSIRVGRCRGP